MMRGIIALFVLFASTLYGQAPPTPPSYVRMDFSLQNAQGQAISGANVFVYSQSACGQPAGPEQQLYSSANGGPIHQPLKTDGFGHAAAYLAPVCVTVKYQSPQTGTQTYPDQMPQGGGGGTANPSPPAQSVQLANSTATGLASDPSVTVDPTTHTLGVGDNSTSGIIKVNGGCTGTCATLDSPDGITWRAGQNLSVSGNLQSDAVATGPSTAPICPNGAGGAFTTSGCVAGGSPGGTNLQMQFNNAGAFGGATGVTVDSATKSVVSGNKFAGSGPPLLDITSAQFGGICDGTTDIGPALQAAWNALPSLGGEILIPGSPNACYWANPTTFDWGSKVAPVTLIVQGQLRTGTTLTTATSVSTTAANVKLVILGRSATGGAQFSPLNQMGQIFTRPSTNIPILGTIGTAITANFTGTGNPSGANPTACTTGITGQVYNDTAGTSAYLWTCALTTGSMSSTTNPNQLTVASTGGFVLGDTITIAGAGAAGANLNAVITGVSGSVFTVSNPALTTVTGASVTNISSGVLSNWRPGAAVTVTPSSMAGIFPKTALNIVGTTTCNLSTISRAAGTVTGVFSSECHIPTGSPITVAGVADSSYNGTHPNGNTAGAFLTSTSDYVTNTNTWGNAGVDGSSSGGTVTGTWEDNQESIIVLSTTSTTFTGLFFRLHAASDQYGVVAVSMAGSGGPITIKNIQITSDGLAMRMVGYRAIMDNVAFNGGTGACSGNLTNQALDIIDTNFSVFTGVTSTAYCSPWSIHAYRPWWWTVPDNGVFTFSNSVFAGSGIKMDTGAHGIEIKDNSICDQCGRGFLTIDDSVSYWSGNSQFVKITGSWLQDNPQGYSTCFLHESRPTKGSGIINAELSQLSGFSTCMVNSNAGFDGRIKYTSGQWGNNVIRGIPGSLDTGAIKDGEDRSRGAGMGPSSIPMDTANIVTNPASWTGGSCTVTTGIRDPNGGTGAGQLSVGSGTFNMGIGSKTIAAPVVGDFIYFGGWVRTTTPNANPGAGTSGQAFSVDNNNNANFHLQWLNGLNAADNGTISQLTSFPYDAFLRNDGWHAVVTVGQVRSTNGASSIINLYLGCSQFATMQYFQPFLAYLPAGSGTTAVTIDEALRIRAQLLHGMVPTNYNGPGIPATAAPIAAAGYYNLNPAGGAPNAIIPPYMTSVGGSSAGTMMPNAVPWATPSANSPVCHDTNGNVTDIGCTSGGNIVGSGASTVGNLLQANNTGTTAAIDSGIAKTSVVQNTIPAWLAYLGDGSEAAPNCTSGCTINYEHWYASVNVPAGQIMSVASGVPLIVRSTGTCTIAGTVSASVNTGTAQGNSAATNWGGSGGGGGFGAANGTAGSVATPAIGGTAGTSGNPGGNGGTNAIQQQHMFMGNGLAQYATNAVSGVAAQGGAAGGAGGSSGGAGGKGGGLVIFACQTINFTGTIDASGQNGGAGGSNTGGGGGGGGGIVILRSPNMTNSGTINTAGGAGGAIGTGTSTKGGDGGAGWSKVFSQ